MRKEVSSNNLFVFVSFLSTALTKTKERYDQDKVPNANVLLSKCSRGNILQTRRLPRCPELSFQVRPWLRPPGPAQAAGGPGGSIARRMIRFADPSKHPSTHLTGHRPDQAWRKYSGKLQLTDTVTAIAYYRIKTIRNFLIDRICPMRKSYYVSIHYNS